MDKEFMERQLKLVEDVGKMIEKAGFYHYDKNLSDAIKVVNYETSSFWYRLKCAITGKL